MRPRLEEAACRGREDLYLKRIPSAGDLALMRKVCGSCRDRPECLAWALEREEGGFWAGHTPADRRRLREQYGIELKPIVIGSWVQINRNSQGGSDGHDELDGAATAHGD
jgi:transcription factor WhiB